MRVGLLPVGPVPPEVLAHLTQALKAYGLGAERLPPVPLPGESRDPRSGQFPADALLGRAVVEAAGPVLAVTGADLSAEGFAFVFGLANAGASGAVVSIHRLAATDEDLFLDRVVKECVHELGHTWGLGHCPDPACVMHFSNSLAETDLKGATFCESCRASLPEGVHPPPSP